MLWVLKIVALHIAEDAVHRCVGMVGSGGARPYPDRARADHSHGSDDAKNMHLERCVAWRSRERPRVGELAYLNMGGYIDSEGTGQKKNSYRGLGAGMASKGVRDNI